MTSILGFAGLPVIECRGMAMAGARSKFGAPVRLEQEMAGRAELQASGHCSTANAGGRKEEDGAVAVG